jgi:hypothetical protein
VTTVGGNKLDGLWFETWSKLSRQGVVYMTIYIHKPIEKRTKLEPSRKKGTFVGYIVSHMEIDSEEKEASKDDRAYPSSPVVHPSDYKEELVEPTELVDLPRDVVVTRKRPTWLRDTLQNAEGHADPHDTFKERKRPQRFLSYI